MNSSDRIICLLVHLDLVFRICLRFSSNPLDEEDLAQESYLRAMRKVYYLNNTHLSRGWLAKIAKNTCLNYVKKRRLDCWFYLISEREYMEKNTPEGEIWGCYMFSDYFRGREKNREFQEYCFGPIGRFVVNHKKIYPIVLSNYASLSMDNFSTDDIPCLFCSKLEDCVVCPIVAYLSGGSIGKIPNHVCEIQKIKKSQTRKFREDISRLIQCS